MHGTHRGASDPGGLARQSMAFVLAGGRGSRLRELTDRRAKPAVYFGGKARIIDFALSNAVNSGIRRIGVATQYKAHSLIRHLQRGWSFFNSSRGEGLDILPASQRVDERNWYLGTADAVFQNIDIVEGYEPKYMVILAGDHIYKMDYSRMIAQHVESGADVTVGCIEVSREEASAFGVMAVGDGGKITEFLEKPADPPEMPGRPGRCLASMGIYVFETAKLIDILQADAEDARSEHDFGKDIIPALVAAGGAQAHSFSESCVMTGDETEPYWRDVGTVDAFHQANIDLTQFEPSLDIWSNDWPIWTYSELTPPAKFVHDSDGRRGSAFNALVSGGCIVSGSQVRESLLFTGVKAHSYSELRQVVALPYVTVNRHARLRNVVIDSGVEIPRGLVVGEDRAEDARWFRVSEGGVILITADMLRRRAEALGGELAGVVS
ncbi:glucose-1-phosphate adenylyltransferase [Albimonas pacifica]|uniref:Glucose-1-phosphate adenylyltransferase n=1 Tax=Albimonas pacifica TaxID=1114924 RepID=A0A1I3H0G9_9RHOB|nr:glucose-1-phosphate adenylyltransferase [Albimonas pacifica]SFI29030.1 glucose-1-phosphate adenylyltransferase [Albimonas pacifica]